MEGAIFNVEEIYKKYLQRLDDAEEKLNELQKFNNKDLTINAVSLMKKNDEHKRDLEALKESSEVVENEMQEALGAMLSVKEDAALKIHQLQETVKMVACKAHESEKSAKKVTLKKC